MQGNLIVYIFMISLLFTFIHLFIYAFIHLHINILKPSQCLNSSLRQVFCISFSTRIQSSQFKSHSTCFFRYTCIYTPRGTMMSRIRKKTHQPGHYPKFHVEIRNYFVKWICQSCTSVCVARLSAVPQKTIRRELEEFFQYRA